MIKKVFETKKEQVEAKCLLDDLLVAAGYKDYEFGSKRDILSYKFPPIAKSDRDPIINEAAKCIINQIIWRNLLPNTLKKLYENIEIIAEELADLYDYHIEYYKLFVVRTIVYAVELHDAYWFFDGNIVNFDNKADGIMKAEIYLFDRYSEFVLGTPGADKNDLPSIYNGLLTGDTLEGSYIDNTVSNGIAKYFSPFGDPNLRAEVVCLDDPLHIEGRLRIDQRIIGYAYIKPYDKSTLTKDMFNPYFDELSGDDQFVLFFEPNHEDNRYYRSEYLDKMLEKGIVLDDCRKDKTPNYDELVEKGQKVWHEVHPNSEYISEYEGFEDSLYLRVKTTLGDAYINYSQVKRFEDYYYNENKKVQSIEISIESLIDKIKLDF